MTHCTNRTNIRSSRFARHAPWVLALATLWCGGAQAQSVSHGKQVFESVCMECHSLDTHRAGPALRTVVGRPAGKAPGYFYSEAMESATHVWNPMRLKAWLTNPEGVVPGQEMNVHLESARDRDDVVAYLVSVSVPVSVPVPASRHRAPPTKPALR